MVDALRHQATQLASKVSSLEGRFQSLDERLPVEDQDSMPVAQMTANSKAVVELTAAREGLFHEVDAFVGSAEQALPAHFSGERRSYKREVLKPAQELLSRVQDLYELNQDLACRAIGLEAPDRDSGGSSSSSLSTGIAVGMGTGMAIGGI